MTKRIKVRDGQNLQSPYYAIVDDEDFDFLNQFKWYSYKHWRGKAIYAQTSSRKQKGTTLASQFMHKIITGFIQTDHRNGIGLDNRRNNLREATAGQNIANRGKRPHCNNKAPSSQFKGVCWNKKNKNWGSHISVSGKRMFLGSFEIEEDAAKAYDQAALKHYGEFAHLNFRQENC